MERRLFSYAALFVFVLFLIWVGFGLAGMKANSDHGCYAPCTVKFHGQMAEDEFGIDYVGEDKTVKVFRVQP